MDGGQEKFICVLTGILLGGYVDELSRDTSVTRVAEVMGTLRERTGLKDGERIRYTAERELLLEANVDADNIRNMLDSSAAAQCGLAGPTAGLEGFRASLSRLQGAIDSRDMESARRGANDLRNELFGIAGNEVARINLG